MSQGRLPAFMLRYLGLTAVLNLIWECAQLPLYTLWQQGSTLDIAFAVVHCTAGDILIAALALLAAFLIFGKSSWRAERYTAVATAAVVLGLVYTGYSEWLNVYVRKSWAYSDHMPVIPVFQIGLAPLLQWLVIPTGALMALRPS